MCFNPLAEKHRYGGIQPVLGGLFTKNQEFAGTSEWPVTCHTADGEMVMRVLLIALISMVLATTSFAQSRGGGRSFAGHSVARAYGGGFRGGYYGGRYYSGRFYGGVGLGFGLGYGYGYAPYYYPYATYPYPYYGYYPYYPAPYYYPPVGGAVVIGGGWRHFRR